MSITVEKNQGLCLPLAAVTPTPLYKGRDAGSYYKIRSYQGGGEFFQHDNAQLILQYLGDFLPRATERPAASGGTEVLYEHRMSGQDVCHNTAPLDSGVEIPASEIERLQAAIATLKAKETDPATDPGKRTIIAAFRLPDPRKDPELYRLYGPRNARRLIVLWGVEKEQGTSLAPHDAVKQVPQNTKSSWLKWLLWVLLALLALLLLWFLLAKPDGQLNTSSENSSAPNSPEGTSPSAPLSPNGSTSTSAASRNIASDSSMAKTLEAASNPTEKPTAIPADATTKPTEKPTAIPADATTKPVDKPTAIPADATTKPVDKPTVMPANAATKPADKPTVMLANAATKPADKPTVMPANAATKPADKPTVMPAEAATKPVDKSTVMPADAATKPVDKPTVMPADAIAKAEPVTPVTKPSTRATPEAAAKPGSPPPDPNQPYIEIVANRTSSTPSQGLVEVDLQAVLHSPDGSMQPLGKVTNWQVDHKSERDAAGKPITDSKAPVRLGEGQHQVKVTATLPNGQIVTGEAEVTANIKRTESTDVKVKPKSSPSQNTTR